MSNNKDKEIKKLTLRKPLLFSWTSAGHLCPYQDGISYLVSDIAV